MAVDPRPVMPPAPAPPSLRLPALRWLVGLPLALLLLVVVAGAALLYSQAGSRRLGGAGAGGMTGRGSTAIRT